MTDNKKPIPVRTLHTEGEAITPVTDGYPALVRDSEDKLVILSLDDNNNLPVVTSGPTSPTILNISATTLGEYTISIPAQTKRVLIKTRKSSTFHLAFVAGQTSTNYLTINAGCTYEEQGISLAALTSFYVSPQKPNEIIEVLYWL